MPEDRILFLTIIAAPEGVHRVCSSFPGVKLLTSEGKAAGREGSREGAGGYTARLVKQWRW